MPEGAISEGGIESAGSSGNELIRILVIEDSSDHSELLLRQLRKANLADHVKIIADGEQAWNYLNSEHRSDKLLAIFLDLTLPTVNGVELLRKIRAHARLATIPVIVVSASVNPAEKIACENLKVTAFIEKPISFSTFSKAVADVFHSQPESQGG